MKPLGYCGVVLPRLLFWQGFFIPDIPTFADEAEKMIGMARDALGQDDHATFGALQAAFVDGAARKEQAVIAIASRAILMLKQEPFFVVEATIDGDGTRTQFESLNVQDVEGARQAIERHPTVSLIKAQLILQMEHGEPT